MDKITVVLLDGNGMQVGANAIEDTFASFAENQIGGLTRTADGYEFWLQFGLNPQFADVNVVEAIDVRLGDGEGLWSVVTHADRMEPNYLERDAACDPNDIFNQCGAEDACYGEEPLACRQASPPVLDSGRAVIDEGLVAIEVRGTDPEDNPAGVEAVAILEDGTELEPAAAPFGYLTRGEAGFLGRAVIRPFVQQCLPDAQAVFDECAQSGESQDVCIERANENLAACEAELTPSVVRVRVKGIDETNKIGEAIEVEVVDAEVIAAGEICDAAGHLDGCEGELSCMNLAAEEDEPICQELVDTCPAWYGDIVDLNANEADGSWVYEGNSEGAPNLAVGGCAPNGVGGPNVVHAFVAPAAGTYSATTGGTDGDTLLFARSHCALASHEVACNDDIDTQGQNYRSAVEVDLEEGEAVYFFIDGFLGEFAGPYTLTIRTVE